MKLLVLAAGYATRLRPLTDHKAKPLLPLSGRPMIDLVLDCFSGCTDIDEVYVVTNHRFARDFESWAEEKKAEPGPYRVRVFDDKTLSNEDRLGAIGDMNFVITEAAIQDDLVVVAGDNLFTEPLTGFIEAAKQRGILVGVYDVLDLELVKKYNNIRLKSDGRIIFFEEKPTQPESTLIAIALYHYPRWALPFIKQYIAEGNNPDQPGRLVEWLYPRVSCYAYRIVGEWLDIGSKDSYEAAQQLMARSAGRQLTR